MPLYNWPANNLDPAVVNQLPNPTVDFGDAISTSMVRTKMDSAYVRQRRRTTVGMRSITVGWDLTSAQKAAFEGIIRHFLNGGADWFNMSLDLGSGFQTYVVRFVSGQFRSSYVPVDHWKVTAKLETENISVLTQTQTEDYLTPP